MAVTLLRSRALAPLVAPGSAPGPEMLHGDADLDRWIRSRLTTAVHLAGTARMGPDADPGATVDQRLRVRGVAGLRVVDTAVLPEAPSRGPAATAGAAAVSSAAARGRRSSRVMVPGTLSAPETRRGDCASGEEQLVRPLNKIP